jgi:hypothetical protein
MAGSLWLGAPPLPRDGLTHVLPLAPGHALGITFWTHDLAFSTAYSTAGLTRQTPGPLRLMVWYRHPATFKLARLLVVHVPAWPPLLAALMLAMTGGWLWFGASPHTPVSGVQP